MNFKAAITPLVRIIAFCFLFGSQARAQDVPTQHNDNARTGAQLHETTLTPADVRPGTFGRLYERHVEGQIITQPLYLANYPIPGKGLRNVVYVATRKNWIYAFDADNTDPDPSHGLVWTAPVQVEAAAPVPGMCGETRGPVGITSTPAIDRASGTMYAVARKSDGTIWLHAIDVGTGLPKSGTPGSRRITASLVNGTGDHIDFNQGLELNRAGLLFDHGTVYLAFSALNCDNAGWRGWVLAYRASDLTQIGAFVTVASRTGEGGGIWHSGNGLVADADGSIYFETGNGSVNGVNDLGESFVKLRLGPALEAYGLSPAGHYTVSNFAALNGGDTDLGSGGPLLLPGGELIGGGKQGKLYVLNTSTMAPSQNPPSPGPVPPGGSDGFQAFFNTFHDDSSQVVCTSAWLVGRKCYMPRHRYEEGEAMGPNIHGAPIYWDGANPSFGLIYAMPEKDYLRAFRYDKGTRVVATAASAISGVRSPDGMPGSFLALSANGVSNGIVWALMPKVDSQWQNGPARFVAFDALSLGELWRDEDDIGFAKFTPPTVAGGKVFRPTFANKLIVYGLKTVPDPAPCYNIAQKYENYTGPEGLLGNPATAQSSTPDGIGVFQHFDGGSIYWTPSTCAFEVHGAIRGLWQSLGWERSFLGYPLTDESATPDSIGRYNHFQGGSIYWTPLTGAHEVHGAIRVRWAALGWERGTLGYPVSDETDETDGTGRFSLFEHGSIHWNAASGAVTVRADANLLVGVTQAGIDRPGADFTSFNLPAANPAMCQQQCADNASCRSWTYVNPGSAGTAGAVLVKERRAVGVVSSCCTSGVKAAMTEPVMHSLAGAVDRPGSDFASFDLPNADYHLCQSECAANGSCRAWTYVEPGIQGPQARCWLKNAAPAPVPNSCCVSGAR